MSWLQIAGALAAKPEAPNVSSAMGGFWEQGGFSVNLGGSGQAVQSAGAGVPAPGLAGADLLLVAGGLLALWWVTRQR